MLDKQTFDERLTEFAANVRDLINNYYKSHYPNLVSGGYVPNIEIMRGARYIRLVAKDVSSRRAFCFVDSYTGDILKAAGWKAPAKGIRGNIFADDYGMSAITPHGAVYFK